MSANLWKTSTSNAFSTTLNGGITDTDTTITLTSVTGLQAPGVLVIDRIDANNTSTPTIREYISFTGIAGLAITGCSRNLGGSLAQSHSSGAKVEEAWSVTHWNDFIDSFTAEHTSAGNHSSAVIAMLAGAQTFTGTKTIPSPVLTGTPVLNSDSAIPFYGDSMSRQAIMNGNFDVWQRGTSVAIVDNTLTLLADRWQEKTSKDGGTLPTLTRSRQILTSGDIPNAFYYSNLATNGAGTSLGVNSYHYLTNKIEHGTRLLCGLNKTVTVSFWAKSDIAGKRICPTIQQNYGSTGSPTAVEYILGTPITLTSTWTKYTATFTTNTLAGKTFGTDNNDFLGLYIYGAWGTTFGNSYVQASVTAETFVGSGNIDIAQVQLCAGDVALPFMPKSFDDELRACQRYCQAFISKNIFGALGSGSIVNATTLYAALQLITPMLAAPTLTATASDFKANSMGGALQTVSSISIEAQFTSDRIICLVVGVASGLMGDNGFLFGDGVGKQLTLSAEL